jgi:hypothetical protein
MRNFHLTKDGEGWILKEEGGREVKSFTSDKQEAIRESATFIESSGEGSLKIHTEDGRFEEERTYPRSADPRKSEG